MRRKVKYNVWVLVFLLILPPSVYAQKDTTRTVEGIKNIVTVEEDTHRTRVTVPGAVVEVDDFNDTITRITIGRRRFDIIEKDNRHTRIQMVHEPMEAFKGHWAGFDLGLTNFFYTSPFESGIPDNQSWLDLNGGKSVSVGMNLMQYSIGLQKHKTNFGVVTGLGWIINNYRLDSPNILIRGEDGSTTYRVSDRTVEKNKLVTSHLTVPVLLELQLPSGNNERGFFISAGMYGSFRVGSHTKVVFSDPGGREKEKWREDLNINAFKYGTMVRMGFKWIKLYAKCDLSPLFEKDRGPEVYPWTVGVTLVQF
jgi:hypothetical protein